jgi:ABC-type enterochelin transport system ATPase subunit
MASPYARRRACEGEKVVNMRLEATVLTETSRRVLQQLDGKHDRAALVALVQARIDERATDDAAINAEEYVEQLLQRFARGALLVG